MLHCDKPPPHLLFVNCGGGFLVRLAFIQLYCFSLFFRRIISEGAFCTKIQRAASSFALSKLRSRSFFWYKNPSSKIVLPLEGQRTLLSCALCICLTIFLLWIFGGITAELCLILIFNFQLSFFDFYFVLCEFFPNFTIRFAKCGV